MIVSKYAYLHDKAQNRKRYKGKIISCKNGRLKILSKDLVKWSSVEVTSKCLSCGRLKQVKKYQDTDHCHECWFHRPVGNCTIPGCEDLYHAKGFCNKHYIADRNETMRSTLYFQIKQKNSYELYKAILESPITEKLTNTEKKIISLRSKGLSIGHIAKELRLGKSTVAFHLNKFKYRNFTP